MQDNVTTKEHMAKELAEMRQRVVELESLETEYKKNLAQLSKKTRYEETVSTVTRSVHQSINLQEVLENALDSMSKNIDVVEHVAIYLVEGGEAVMKAYRGHPDWFVKRVGRIPYPKGFTWKAIIEGKPLYCPDVDQDTVIGPAGREVGTKSYAAMPVHFKGKTVGCINIHSFEKNAFDEEDLRLLEIVAQQIETAIGNAKQAETLKESEQRYRTLVENAPEAIVVLDVEKGRFIDTNENAARLFKLTRAQMLNRGPVDLSPPFQPDGRPSSESAWERIQEARDGGVPKFEWTHRNANGDDFPCEISLVRLPSATRTLIRGSVVDITDRKKLEEERLRFDKLESVGILAGGIAHDFNNLLAAILTSVSLAKMNVQPRGELYESLEDAEKACHQAKRLTQQLLTFAKGGTPIKRLASLEEIVKESSRLALRGSKSRCELSLEENLWNAEIDEGQISQVINNLIINADQAMPQGGKIKVTARNLNVEAESFLPIQRGRYVKITIEDKGVGIPKEHLSKIFDPYFTTKQKGSGLGLATVYSIIRSHNGYIEVESEPGIGTKFYIYLPASAERLKKKRAAKRTGAHRKILDKKKKILLMDDEALVRLAAGKALADLGYDVEYARDGVEAVDMYKNAMENGKSFNVVIMDLTIPGGMGGREAIKKLIDIDPEVKAIVSSGYSNDPIMSHFRDYGFKGVVVKPYEVEGLAEAINNVIGS